MSKSSTEKRKPHAIYFDPAKNLTRGSFKDECDPNKIVETYARTGMINHVARGEPQFGEAPDGDFLDHALVQAAIKTAREEGFQPSDPDEKEDTTSEEISTTTDDESQSESLSESENNESNANDSA